MQHGTGRTYPKGALSDILICEDGAQDDLKEFIHFRKKPSLQKPEAGVCVCGHIPRGVRAIWLLFNFRQWRQNDKFAGDMLRLFLCYCLCYYFVTTLLPVCYRFVIALLLLFLLLLCYCLDKVEIGSNQSTNSCTRHPVQMIQQCHKKHKPASIHVFRNISSIINRK